MHRAGTALSRPCETPTTPSGEAALTTLVTMPTTVTSGRRVVPRRRFRRVLRDNRSRGPEGNGKSDGDTVNESYSLLQCNG